LLSIDPSSATVFTGTMDQQPVSFVGAAELAGSFTAATANSGASAASQAVMNLLFTSALPNFTLSGQQDETDGGQHPGQPVAGAYTLQGDGSGTIALTQPGTSNYVICVLDNPLLDKTNKASSIVQHFVMINVDPSNTNPSVIFGER
jgi:hypothetical protein